MNYVSGSATALLILGAMGAGLWLGRHGFEEETVRKLAHYEELLVQLPLLSAENTQLSDRLASCTNDARMDQLALRGSQETLSDMQQQISSLLKEIGFYQRILSRDDPGREIFVEDVQIAGGQESSLRLVLTQNIGRAREAEGKLMIAVTGRFGNQPATLSLSDIDAQEQSALSFKFRYYKILQQPLQLPPQFTPQILQITVILKDKKEPSLSQSWDWGDILRSGETR